MKGSALIVNFVGVGVESGGLGASIYIQIREPLLVLILYRLVSEFLF